jgi:hypothetical protein
MLSYLRSLEGFRLVWVDAICINQADYEERNAQVAKWLAFTRTAEGLLFTSGKALSTQHRDDTQFGGRFTA